MLLRNRTLCFCFFNFFWGVILVTAQTFTARSNTYISTHSNGFYEYLPQGYNQAANQLYPLLIASHGVGERGNGSAAALQILIQPGKGLAALLSTGTFPTAFTVNSQNFSFIILCPQYADNGTSWPATQNIEEIINYALANYKVDINRIYLTGLSMGGGLSFRYVTESITNASKIAAFVPVCAALQPGPPYASKPDSLSTRNITTAQLPVWATHNDLDPVVPVSFTDSMVHYINASPATAIAKKTIFNSMSHDAWTQTYDPSFTDAGGLNIYQWMLQFQRSFAVLPVHVKDYRVFRSSPSQITISWNAVSQVNHDHFTLERSSNGIDFTTLAVFKSGTNEVYSFADVNPIQGDNFYRLSATDLNGTRKLYGVLKMRFDVVTQNVLLVNPNPVIDVAALQLNHEAKGNITVSLLDMKGHLLKKWMFHKTNFNWRQEINLVAFPFGTYLIHVKGENLAATTTILIH